MKILDKNDCSYSTVNLINENGEKLGVVSFLNAVKIAQKMDLALVNERMNPPIVKIVNYGKILYEQKKNLKKQRTNIVKNKEVKFGLNIAENDYNVKINKIKDFIEDGDRVKVTLFLKGREVSFQEIAFDFMNTVVNDISAFANTNDKIKLVGNCISLNFTKKQQR